jgi:hypothetical protein
MSLEELFGLEHKGILQGMLNPDLQLPTFFQVFGKLLAKNNHTTLRKEVIK